MEATFPLKTESRVAMMNGNYEAKFLLIQHVHISCEEKNWTEQTIYVTFRQKNHNQLTFTHCFLNSYFLQFLRKQTATSTNTWQLGQAPLPLPDNV
jgi:hypothetical protein